MTYAIVTALEEIIVAVHCEMAEFSLYIGSGGGGGGGEIQR